VPRTGALSLLASRQHPELAQVIEATSNLQSRTAQVTAGMNGVAFTGLIWNMSYTFMRSTDQTSFSGGGGRGTGSSTTAATRTRWSGGAATWSGATTWWAP
jgi:hypothetical protein